MEQGLRSVNTAINMNLSPSTNLGHYEILTRLGAGGMGEVYLAQDKRLNRKVALKVLPSDLINNRQRLLRFEQEAQAASALNHPNILTIHEIGVEANIHFIATEFIQGETLRQKLQTTRLDIKETLTIACKSSMRVVKGLLNFLKLARHTSFFQLIALSNRTKP